MTSLDIQLEEINQQKKQILEKIDVRNKDREIECQGCQGHHKIGDLTAIQDHWYTQPTGCIGGAYWNEGELQFVCPETAIINRLLFNDHNVPLEERRNYGNSPEEQFKINYKKLFREVKDSYDEEIPGKWVNNYYVDENHKKFGLVEKRKLRK